MVFNFWDLLSDLPIEMEDQVLEKVMINVSVLAHEAQLSTYDAF